MKKRIGKWGYMGIFIALASFFGYMWVIVRIFSGTEVYTADILKRDLILSIGMAVISTFGLYLKVILAQRNKKAE